MIRSLRSPLALALAVALLGAAHDGTPVGFVDLSKALAAHPLASMLAGYDRGIAALRSTQTVPGLTDPAGEAARAAAALSRDTAVAESDVQSIVARDGGQNRARERDALAAVLASRDAADREMLAFRDELVRGTQANLAAYEGSIGERNDRALAARDQEMRERELTLAFRLARQNAATRLTLRLKLRELHLDAATRARFEGELSALDRRQADTIAAMRRIDTAIFDRYRQQLARDGAVAIAQMAAQLRAKADANLALRRRVLEAEARAAAMLPNFPLQLASFGASYRFETDAAEIVGGLRAAGRDLSRRFALLGDAARTSRRETDDRIAALRARRATLYRSMVAQIDRIAGRLARERHLDGVQTSGARPQDSVDLTAAVRAEVARF
ncbi:MAG: hypothetical protein WA814_07440 [Candidatus Baltobacteraceae bacterium]